MISHTSEKGRRAKLFRANAANADVEKRHNNASHIGKKRIFTQISRISTAIAS